MLKAGRILSILLAVVLLFGTMPASTVRAANPNWQDSGELDTAWYTDQTAAGHGGEANPYVIDTAGELAGLASLVNNGTASFKNKYIMLDADLDLSGRDWTPIGNNSNRFTGHFNGNGHIIKNLTRYAETWQEFGLFGWISVYPGSTSIKNLGVVDVNIDGLITQCGGIAAFVGVDGYGTSATFENCFVTGKIHSNANTGELGGLVGSITIVNSMNCGMVINNCYAAADISLTTTNNESYYTRYAGGLIGQVMHLGGTNATVTVNNSYAASKVTTANISKSRIGGFAGYVNTTNQITVNNCLFDLQAAGISYGFGSTSASFDGVQGMLTSEMTGTSALPATWNGSVWSAQSDLYPQLNVFGGSDSSQVSAIPVFLFENGTIPSLSDTSANVKHSFNVPVPAGVTWSADPSDILAVDGSGNVNFTSPATDTNVTLTAQWESGAKKQYNLLCKSGVTTDDTTPPEITFGVITPADLSASIPVTSNESADIYVMVKAVGDAAPGAGEIVANSSTKKGSGVNFTAAIGGLQHSTNFLAYAVGIDTTGNVSEVKSSPFTTLLDQTPPSWTSYSGVQVIDGTAKFDYTFNESGTVYYVILPTSQPAPSKEQIANGQDASGNLAVHSYYADYPTAGASNNASVDIKDYAPDSYVIYMICMDSYGNKSSIIKPADVAFSIQGKVTFTITDGTSPVAGADIKVGTETISTDTNGKAVFTLSGGTYSYQVSKIGFRQAEGTLTVDNASISKELTLSSLDEGIRTFTFKVQDGTVPLTSAKVTIGSETNKTDASGQVKFYLEDGNYEYTVSSMGYITKTVNISVSGDGNETVTLELDPAGVTVDITAHTTNNLGSEIDAYMSANGILSYASITGLKVSGGSISNTDTNALHAIEHDVSLKNSLKIIDFSGTIFEGNSVPNYALNSFTALTEVVLPDSVTTIGNWSFYNCTSLETVHLPANINSIGDAAFYQCSSLKDIFTSCVTPPTVVYGAFTGVAKGAAIHVSEGSEGTWDQGDPGEYKDADKRWYDLLIEDLAPTIVYSKAIRTSETTAKIYLTSDEQGTCYYMVTGDGAAQPIIDTSEPGATFNDSFGVQFDLTGLAPGPYDLYVKAKDSRGNVGEMYKIDLEEYIEPVDVIINEHVAGNLVNEIDAFMNSLGLPDRYDKIKSLKVSGETLNIDDWDTFYNYDMANVIQTINLSGTWSERIPDYPFEGYSNLTSISLPAGIESIGDYAFWECSNLADITLWSSTPPSVGEDAFYGIPATAVVHVPAGSVAAYKAVDDGDTTDNLWYGLSIVAPGLGSAQINPVRAFFDLDDPQDISTTITWNDASIVESVYGEESLEEGTDYTIDLDKLTIKQEYLLSLNPADGDSMDFEISFDAGDRAMLTVNIVNGLSITTGSISGTISDGDSPVEGAIVSLTVNDSVYSDVTKADGSYTILNIPAGIGYTVTVNKTGYISGSVNDVTVTVGATTSDVDITLSPIQQTYTVTFNSQGGSPVPSINNLNSGSSISAPTVPTRSGYTFKGWYKESACTHAWNFSTYRVTGNTTLYAGWSANTGGGSSGSGGSGGSGGGTTITIQPENRPNQPVMAGLSATPTVDRNGHATVTIPEKSVADAIAKALAHAISQGKTANGIGIALDIDLPDTAKSLGLVLPQAALKDLIEGGVRNLEINGGIVSLNLDMEALKEIQNQSTGDLTITLKPVQTLSAAARKLIGARPVYDLTITYIKDGKTVTIGSLNKGHVTISIPYTPGNSEAVGHLFGVYVDDRGNASRIAGSNYDANSRSVILTTNHFSVYGVGYQSSSEKFTDVNTHWAKDNIDYVVGRGLFSGTSDQTFSPNTAMSRGMMVTVLGRLAGADVSSYKTSSFTDVKKDSYYLPYIEWAYKKGIVNGVGNNQFAPDKAVTREEMAVILQNYAKATGYTLSVTQTSVTFADSSRISSYAKDAVKAMLQSGIMTGDQNNRFNPKACATRAEVAAVVQRYVKLTIDPATT